MAHAFFVDVPWSCLSSFHSSPKQIPTFYPPSTVRERNQGLFRDDADYLVLRLCQLTWLTYFIVQSPWFLLSSSDSCPEQAPIFYRPSTVQETSQTNVVSWWHGQSRPETRRTDGWWILFWIYHGLAWARLTLVLSKCQHFTGPPHLEK